MSDLFNFEWEVDQHGYVLHDEPTVLVRLHSIMEKKPVSIPRAGLISIPRAGRRSFVAAEDRPDTIARWSGLASGAGSRTR